MSIVNKALSTWGSIVNKFWAFDDGKTAPGQVLLDPATGEPIERFGLYNPTWEERMLAEGEMITIFGATAYNAPVHWAGTTNTTEIVNSGSEIAPRIGEAMWIESISAWCNIPILAQVSIAPDANARFDGFYWRGGVGPATVTIPVRSAFKGEMIQTGVLSLAVRNVFDSNPTTVDLYGAISAVGWRLTADFDWAAPKVVMFYGDSILNGASGPTKTALQWAYIVKEHLRSLGTNARIVLKTLSGSTTADHAAWNAAGYHDIPQVDCAIYAVGVNDAINAVSTATSIANIATCWTRHKLRFPQAPFIVCGPTPLNNNTYETAAASLRTAISNWVAAQDDARLQYINLGAAFDRTVLGNYTSNDGIHPNDTTHPLVGAAAATEWDALGITI